MATNIVTLNVTQTVGATPSNLQQTGLIVTQGGTTTAIDTVTLLTQASSLTPILTAAQALTSLAWATGTVTATTTAPHGYPIGQTLELTIAGAVPAGYNGTFVCTITSTTQFTYPLASDPGTETTPGTVINAQVAYLTADVTTFFAQGAANSIYVLELGANGTAAGVAALTTFLTDNPNQYYLIKVPTGWDAEPTFSTLAGNYTADTAKTYFFVTVTDTTYTNFTTAKPKSVFMEIQAVAAPATESSIMAAMWTILNRQPSATNQVPPTAFAYQIGVTPFFSVANTPTESTYKAAYLNYIATGAEGGISNTILKWGTTADGRDFTYWYSVDWIQINLEQAIANEVINGSNNTINPLLYNQQGINRLQTRAQSVVNSAIQFGLALGPLTVNAQSFQAYLTANPNDYKTGTYNGLSLTYIPSKGFDSITFNLNVTDFALQ